jgi:hypothetical protein
VILVGGTAQLEFGDQSKPYRLIPMFSPDVAAKMPRGAVPSLVHQMQEPTAPLEQLPLDRYRFAAVGRIAHRLETATIRAEERIYTDTWGLKASTTDARFLVDINKELRVGPHIRFHIQDSVDFWKRAYSATLTPTGWSLPKLRTGDREMGPLFGVTAGGTVRYQLSELFAAQVEVQGIYTQFLDHIYIFDRLGVFTATTLEMEVE